MTREEAISMLKSKMDGHTNTSYEWAETVRMAIKALEQGPCEDAISRQAVLSMQYRIDDSTTLSTRDVVNVDDIEDLPPVKQKSKTGHWIKKDYWKPLPFDVSPLDWDNYDEKTHSEKVSHWYCSKCDTDKGENRPVAKFCEDCGARMQKEDE